MYNEEYFYDESFESRPTRRAKGNREKQKDSNPLRILSGLILLLIFFIGFLLGVILHKTVVNNRNSSSEENSVSSIRKSTDEVTKIIPLIDKPRSSKNDWQLTLVNPQNPLDVDFNPALAMVDDKYFDERASDALKAMLNDAKAQGLSPIICSAYRSIDTQRELFESQVERYSYSGFSREEAENEAAKAVARPGQSEHNLGLAADIVSLYNQMLDESQSSTPEFIWLKENCQNYGFILRYPKDKEDITGVMHEPWHFRYVGEDVAKEIKDKGICLEEYIQEIS